MLQLTEPPGQGITVTYATGLKLLLSIYCVPGTTLRTLHSFPDLTDLQGTCLYFHITAEEVEAERM